ncbi:two-component system, NtrC family, nitrogen regulation sensor histidine kinase NtrY [Parasphingorhabdus marina DSM 22363]|uniref:histidine kinase n=1 Tax=Parasphingorhabdus marina DSM 22363 TaxID=1123272 RepID=A0A1N6FQR5_9SPHN|nr:ATP-binding protein [Parasphingorhabdus marina]SIN97541.1 two-component system, NtrC family, nitrogen regulation sensor histidine kinase NtrY [Parasphingorhabdus marina DSM 22363]
MNAPHPPSGKRAPVWIRRLSILAENDALMKRVEWFVLFVFASMLVGTYFLLSAQSDRSELISPPLAASLLVANLVPAIVLLVLLGRRIAKGRAAKSAIGSNGRLHVRLVALFSLVASIPMLLVVIFASFLFQYGVEFWFSDRARGMLENANGLAQGYYEENQRDVGEETITMANDLRDYLRQARLESPEFAEGYVFQVLSRKLNESAIVEYGDDGVARTAAAVDPDNRETSNKITPEVIEKLAAGETYVVTARDNKIEAVTALDLESRIFLYAARDTDMDALSQWERAQAVLKDYDDLFVRSRSLQLQFNIALFVVSLLIVGLALWIALAVADRMVRPVSELVHAAKRVTEGNLATRVPTPVEKDEIGTLGRAFNRMTERLETQTTALLTANDQLGSRRAFIETVLESVTAGIMSLNTAGQIRLTNSRAQALLAQKGDELLDQPIAEVAPEFAELVAEGVENTIIQFSSGGEVKTLEVKIVAGSAGHVITFEDITQQLLDQRRAAWSDVARRIAHEIKNPLTPIQLAAERLQRRFGKNIDDGNAVFTQLTGTIVRQVGDLRKIVDEFSSFARMPKPTFRAENLVDILKQALFLQDVSNPDINFEFRSDEAEIPLVCDRRQLGQAFTNVTKNAVEAIGQKMEQFEANGEQPQGRVCLTVSADDEHIVIQLDDNGIGLPADRERIVEPYMTTREKGTGLGLAIVKKIIEEHFGEIAFADAPDGGTRVTIIFNPAKLERLGQNPTLEGGIVGQEVGAGSDLAQNVEDQRK